MPDVLLTQDDRTMGALARDVLDYREMLSIALDQLHAMTQRAEKAERRALDWRQRLQEVTRGA